MLGRIWLALHMFARVKASTLQEQTPKQIEACVQTAAFVRQAWCREYRMAERGKGKNIKWNPIEIEHHSQNRTALCI